MKVKKPSVKIDIKFIIGQISEGDFEMLESGATISSKMILSEEDFALFRYKEGDQIQVETSTGNRLWCVIKNLEILRERERSLLIFALKKT